MAYHGTPNVGLLSIGIKVYFIATIGLIQSVPVDLFCRHFGAPYGSEFFRNFMKD